MCRFYFSIYNLFVKTLMKFRRVNVLLNLINCDRIIRKMMLFFLVLVITASSFSGFFSKWAFRDGSTSFGIEAILDETAKRPFVYRQLLPTISKEIVNILPEKSKDKLVNNLNKKKPIESIYSRAAVPSNYAIEYYLMIIFCYGCFFAAIWNLRKILIEVLNDKVAGTLAAFLFSLLFPFFETLGGYYYDFPELLFFTLAVKFALHKNWVGLLVLTPIATYNKEAFFFFLPTLYPFFRQSWSRVRSALLLGTCIFFAGVTYLIVKQQFLTNPGGAVEIHFMQHITELFKLSSYYVTSTTYGLPLGAQMFFLHIIFVIWIIKSTWNHLLATWQQHSIIALIINVPLFWLFCAPGELRNLSLLYMVFALMLAKYIESIMKKYN